MKKVDHYICEVCGTEYADKAQCGRCEKSHKEPREIVKAFYRPITMDGSGHPEHLDIRMSGGQIVRYKKLRKPGGN